MKKILFIMLVLFGVSCSAFADERITTIYSGPICHTVPKYKGIIIANAIVIKDNETGQEYLVVTAQSGISMTLINKPNKETQK